MGYDYLSTSEENISFELRNNQIEVWKDMLTYSSNLNGNWLLSQQVFYGSIVPTAEENPAQFAKWIRKMVKTSGEKVKSRSDFINSINYLRKIKKSKNPDEIKKVLYYLFGSGLDKPTIAINALNNQSA